MKVLFISAVSGMSGAEIVLARFLRRNPDVDAVILLPRGPLLSLLEKEGHRVYRSWGLGQLHRAGNLFWPVVFALRWFVGCLEVIRVCWKEHPEIVQATHFAAASYALVPAKLLGIPVVWHIHDIMARRSLGAWTCRQLGKHVERVIVPSRAVRDSLVRSGISGNKVSVIYNGLDTAKEFNGLPVRRGPLRERLHLGPDALLVGFLGLLAPWKGAHVFLEAIERVQRSLRRPVRFLVIGDGWNARETCRPALEAQAKAAGLEGQVAFTGRLPHIPEVLAQLDIVVHASTAPDPLPNVVLEAMAAGKVVLASDCGGVPEMIEDGVTGFLYPPGDEQALANLLEHCINKFEEVAPMGRRARRRVEEAFSEGKHRQAFAQLYQEVAGPGETMTAAAPEREPVLRP